METLIIMSLVLAILQLWLIPMTIDIKNLNWMIGNRENPLPEKPLLARAKRAGSKAEAELKSARDILISSKDIFLDDSSTSESDSSSDDSGDSSSDDSDDPNVLENPSILDLLGKWKKEGKFVLDG